MGGHDKERRMDRQGEGLIWCRTLRGPCETENGTEINEMLQAGASRHKRVWQLKRIQVLEDGKILPGKQGTGRLKDLGRIT